MAAFLMAGLCGCARDYVVTLNNGSQLGARSKPRLDGAVYRFKDPLGREMTVPVGRVREIAPASMAGSQKLQD